MTLQITQFNASGNSIDAASLNGVPAEAITLQPGEAVTIGSLPNSHNRIVRILALGANFSIKWRDGVVETFVENQAELRLVREGTVITCLASG